MGGIDKGLLPFRGKPLVAHVLERLRPQVTEILLNANREIETYQRFGYPVVSDTIGGFAGPLAGLHCGMAAAKTPWVVSVPCDAPFLAADLVQRLWMAMQKHQADAAVARTGTQPQPVFCLYRTVLLGELTHFLEGGGRKVEAWQAKLKIAVVPFDDEAETFANFNTPAQLEATADA